MFKTAWEKLVRRKDAGFLLADKFAVDPASRRLLSGDADRGSASTCMYMITNQIEKESAGKNEDETYDLDTFWYCGLALS